MSGTDAKTEWSLAAPKPKFGGGTALRFGGGFRSTQNLKGPTTDLEDVVFQANFSSEKTLTQ